MMNFNLLNINLKNAVKKCNRCIMLFAALFSFAVFPLFAQTPSISKFTPDTSVFIEEVNNLLSAVSIQEKDFQFDGKAFMLQFRSDWEQGFYSQKQQHDMCEILNKMVDKHFQIRPYINYFSSVQLIKNHSITKNWDVWHQSLNAIIDHQKPALFSDYLLFSFQLLSNNTFSFYRGVCWQTDNPNFQFRFDSIPYIDLGKTDIMVSYNKDTVVLHETTCKFYPLHYRLNGSGGKIFWDRAKLNREKVWAEVSSYSLETLIHDIKFENVHFFHKDYFPNYITGTLEEKAYSNKTQAPYPQFTSDRLDISIKRLYNNFDFKGGFQMNGAAICGFGNMHKPAHLFVGINKSNSIFIKSLKFNFSPDYITSDNVSFTILCDEDSLYHSEMSMTFNNINKELVLMKGNGTLAKSSVIDSYHRVDIQCDALFWNLNTGIIEIKPAIGLKKDADAKFTSQSYFREGDFRKLRGLDKENPLVILVQMARGTHNNFMTFSQISDVMKITEKQVQLLMSELAVKDFLHFDMTNNGIILREKAFLYADAYRRAIDYDNLVFRSDNASKNARLRLDSMDMEIYNIREIWLSDSQQVGIMTYVNDIVLQKNRDFSFRGFVAAGSFDFFTDSMVYAHFSYKDFSIYLPQISSLEFWVDDPNNINVHGQFGQIPVKSFIEYISGKLYIDEPNNKSGIKHYDKYSYFEAGTTERSAVYYNLAYSPNMYPKDRFKFKVFPFVINNLQTVSVENMNIPGILQSSNIIPDFETALTLRPDYSLGFNTMTPSNGFPMYGNKGIFTGNLDLSNHGFYGDGTLRYLSSTSITDSSDIWDENSYVFFPDSAIADVEKFNIQEVRGGVEYPTVFGDKVKQSWQARKDLMTIESRETPFYMFKEKLDFNGKLLLSPTGLDGIGKIKLTQMSIISSRTFSFKSTSFSSPEADVELLSVDLTKPVFNAYKYGFSMDLEKRSGDFAVAKPTSFVKFPQNGFTATNFNFTLNMDSMSLNLYAKTGEDYYDQLHQLSFLDLIEKAERDTIIGPVAKSYNIHHNGLDFLSYSARLTILPDRHLLDFYEVPFVQVADSYIIPKDGTISLADNPDTIYLKESELMIKNDTIHHYIYDADLNILGRDEYSSKKGTYDYISPTDTIPIALNDIYIDRKTKKSVAKGFISDTLDFKPSPYFSYYGDVKISGESPDIDYFGYVKINEDLCDSIPATWISIDTNINAEQPMIPVPKKTFNDENRVTYTGLAHGNDGQFYTFYNLLFGQMRNSRNDDSVFTVDGFLMYDERSKEYRIGNESVLDNPLEPYNLLTYNPETCVTMGHGKIDLGSRFNQKIIDLQTYGSYTHFQTFDSVCFNLTTELSIPMSKKLMESITNILSLNTSGEAINLKSPAIIKYMNYKFGTEQSEYLRENYTTSSFILPKEFHNTFIFTEIPFKWKQSVYTYYVSEEVGIFSAHNKMILKKIPVRIAYSRHRTGNRDRLQIYFEADPFNAFYILFSERGKSYMWTNNEEIELLLKSKEKEKPQQPVKTGVIKKTEAKNNEKIVDFEWISEKAVLQFLNEMDAIEN